MMRYAIPVVVAWLAAVAVASSGCLADAADKQRPEPVAIHRSHDLSTSWASYVASWDVEPGASGQAAVSLSPLGGMPAAVAVPYCFQAWHGTEAEPHRRNIGASGAACGGLAEGTLTVVLAEAEIWSHTADWLPGRYTLELWSAPNPLVASFDVDIVYE